MSDTRKLGWWRWASIIVLCAAHWAPTEVAAQVVPLPATSSPAKAEPSTSDGKTGTKQEAKPNADGVKDVYEVLRSLSFDDFIIGLRQHGPPIVIVLVAMAGILWLANRLHGRIVRLLAGAANRGSKFEQENRART